MRSNSLGYQVAVAHDGPSALRIAAGISHPTSRSSTSAPGHGRFRAGRAAARATTCDQATSPGGRDRIRPGFRSSALRAARASNVTWSSRSRLASCPGSSRSSSRRFTNSETAALLSPSVLTSPAQSWPGLISCHDAGPEKCPKGRPSAVLTCPRCGQGPATTGTVGTPSSVSAFTS